MIRRARKFAGNPEGSVTIEFVAIFMVFIGLMVFVIETTLYLFFMASLEKAAEAGARAAAVRPPVVAFDRTMNIRQDAMNPGVRGLSCSDASEPCEPPDDGVCEGCLESDDPIFRHMRGFSGLIEPENVRITYRDVGIGFADGPTVPMVTVTISGVQYRTGVFGLLLESIPNGLGTLPTRSASMTGEDLAQ